MMKNHCQQGFPGAGAADGFHICLNIAKNEDGMLPVYRGVVQNMPDYRIVHGAAHTTS